jgi:hypothetical protein
VFFQNQDDLQVFLERKFVKNGQTALIPGSGVDYSYYAPQPRQERMKNLFSFLSAG